MASSPDQTPLEPLSTSERSALQLRITCDKILSTDIADLKTIRTLGDCLDWRNVIVYIKRLILSGHHDAANRTLGALFSVKEYKFSPGDQIMFEIFWKYAPLAAPARPNNTPWPAWETVALTEAPRRFDPTQLDFYDWTDLGNMQDEATKSLCTKDFDVHAWQDSADLLTLSISARLLCRPDPISRRLPSRAALIEAAQILEKLAGLSREPGADVTDAESHIPEFVAFALVLHVGGPATVTGSLEWIGRPEQKIGEAWNSFFLCKGFWEALNTTDPTQRATALSNDEAARIEAALCKALTARAADGKQKELEYETAAGLFQRYAAAAWRALYKDFMALKIAEEQILSPGLDDAGIASVKAKFGGWLDPELEEMSRLHDGFLGGWHYAGGGWPGLESFWEDSGRADYFGYEDMDTVCEERPDEHGVMQSVPVVWEGQGEAIVYAAQAAEADSYWHLLVTPTVWRDMGKLLGLVVPEGQYAFGYYALWAPEVIDPRHSLKDWLAELVMDLELKAFLEEDAC